MTTNRKILLISIVFGLVVLILICFGVYPLLKRIKNNSQEFIAIRKDLILSSGQIGSLAEIKKIYEEIEPDFEKINQFFIDPEVPLDLIKFFEKTAEDSKVSIDISSSSALKKSELKKSELKKSGKELRGSLGFQISLVGSFPNCSRFLEKVETGPYLIEIQDVNIKRLTEAELKSLKYEQFSPGAVSANLAIKVYTK